MSSSVFVDWSNVVPLPTSFLMFVNVSSMFSPEAIASSSTPLFLRSEPAKSLTWPAVTFAEPPVDFSTASV